jgi:hypothetical protein
MPDLVIAAAGLGPLSVETAAVAGGSALNRPVLLSSAAPQATIRGLPAGDYLVIGTRPTGERLVERVMLEDKGGRVLFAFKGAAPHEFLADAAARGLVPSLLSHDGNAAAAKCYVLRQWTVLRDGQKWLPAKQPEKVTLRPDCVQVFIDGASGVAASAIALLDETGFGPVVIAPLFREGLSITLLARGLALESATAGAGNPSPVRVPIAIALPRDAGLADLLSGLSAPSLPSAEELWMQVAARRGGIDHAVEAQMEAYQDPAAAVLGAHFLARFSPMRTPVGWLENLVTLLPAVADAPLLLAWRLIAAGSGGNRNALRRRIRDLLDDALSRPCTMFHCTRALLTQAERLYAADRRATSGAAPPFRAGDFLNLAADAGGLEAFWGAAPDRPGPPEETRGARPQNMALRFDGAAFVVP